MYTASQHLFAKIQKNVDYKDTPCYDGFEEMMEMKNEQALAEIGGRIRQKRIEHGLSQQALATMMGYKSRSTINKIELGKNDIVQSTIAMLADVLDCTPGYLMGWASDGAEAGVKNLTPPPKTKKVPRIGSIACGEPILAEQNLEGYDEVPDFIKCDFTLVCKGNSMTGARIYDGDVVCIRAQCECESGQIAAVLVDGMEPEATLKRVRYVGDGVVLWPENPDYEPMPFFGEDAARVHILGVATHFIGAIR